LLFVPNVLADLLLGTTLDGPAALTVARIAGAGLFALGVACWLGRTDVSSVAGQGLTRAMALYNLAAVLVLGYAGLQFHAVGILLWPAVIVHAVMAIWCLLTLIRKPV